MKTNHLFLLLAISMIALFSVGSLSAQDKKKKDKEVVTFYVEGMQCKNCQATIEKNISFEKGVKDLKSDLEKKTVMVEYDPKKTDVEKLKKGFEKIKFPAVVASEKK